MSRTSGPKSFEISKHLVFEAYLRVKADKGAAGVEGESIEQFEADLRGNLYKLWNRLSSGCYFRPPLEGKSAAGGFEIPSELVRSPGNPVPFSLCDGVGDALGTQG